MSSIRLIGLTAHRNKEGAADALKFVSACLKRHGIDCIVDEETAQALGWGGLSLPFDEIVERADMILSLGGDGTLLQVASRVAPSGKPIAAINLGRLGFLTACSVDEAESLVEAIAVDACRIEERSMLQATVVKHSDLCGGGTELGSFSALNEVAIVRVKTGRMVDVETFTNGEFLTNYHADGLLVATPSGSTAYSLSAGGPIICPGAGVLCLTPVSPHSLTNRSLVVSDMTIIEIRSRKNDEGEFPLIFSVDGHEVSALGKDTSLRVRKAPWKLRLIRMPRYSFSELLRAKLSWRGAEI